MDNKSSRSDTNIIFELYSFQNKNEYWRKLMDIDLMKDENVINNIFDNIKELVISSRNKVYTAVNTEMLKLYWNIGKSII